MSVFVSDWHTVYCNHLSWSKKSVVCKNKFCKKNVKFMEQQLSDIFMFVCELLMLQTDELCNVVNLLVLRVMWDDAVTGCVIFAEKLLNSSGREFRRALFSLKQIFQVFVF